MELTHKDFILRDLTFGGKFTTDLFLSLNKSNIEIGVKSLTNRLQELQLENKVIGVKIEGRKEKFWKIPSGELF